MTSKTDIVREVEAILAAGERRRRKLERIAERRLLIYREKAKAVSP